MLKERHADLLVLDLGMPGLTGLAYIRELRETYPQLKILILTANADPLTAQAAITAGADGYVVKGSDLDELLQALDALQRGQPYLSLPEAGAQRPVDGATSAAAYQAAAAIQLTRREHELLVLISGGATTRTVAERLGISPLTARKHRENLMRKLDLHSAAELAAYAVRLGLPVG